MTMQIGALSQATGVHIETIRYYEKIGLAPTPPRSPGGRRIYDERHRRRLVFIRRARELGFGLDDIRSLLGAADDAPTCADVYALTERHLDAIRAKIADLKRLERTLARMAQDCDRKRSPDCPIIDALSSRRASR